MENQGSHSIYFKHIADGRKDQFPLPKIDRLPLPSKSEARIICLANEIISLNPFLNLKGVTVVEIGTGWD